jgi:hypothetical protein
VESGRSEAIKPFPKTGYRLSFSDQRRLNVFASQNAKQWGRFLGGWWQEGQKRDPGGASMGILRCEDSAQNDLVCDHWIREARRDSGRHGAGVLEREAQDGSVGIERSRRASKGSASEGYRGRIRREWVPWRTASGRTGARSQWPSMGILRCEDSAQNDLVCDHWIKEARRDSGRHVAAPLEREVREDMGRNHWLGKAGTT